MTTIIRLMTEEDIDAVRQVEAAAFGAWLQEVRGREKELPRRARPHVLALREKDPGGCFVAEQDGRLVGLIFSRTWGSVGWLGTFAVLPEFHGQGIGKRLIAASLDYLRREPGRVIGLETMPDSPYNLGLYLKQGFQLRPLTLRMSKTVSPSGQDGVELPRWSEADIDTRRRWLADLRRVTGQIRPGLDYSKEITVTARHRLGDTLFLTRDGHAVGMSTVRLVSTRVGQDEEGAAAHPVVLHPAHANAESLSALLAASEALARACGKQRITLPVNGRHTGALEQILRSGYRVERGLVRMVLTGTDGGPCTDSHVHLSPWAG